MLKLKIVVSVLLFTTIYPQVINTPINSGVYDFLERLALKHIINIKDVVKPLSRKYISNNLEEISSKIDQLNEIEKQELEFYKKEYAYELGQKSERWFLYGYTDTIFRFRVSPVTGYGFSGTGGYNGHTRWVGLNVYGSHSSGLSGFFEYKDVGEFGGNIDPAKSVTPATGHFYKSAPNGIEFSDVRGSIGYDFGWGSITVIKDYSSWGLGRFGSMILSEKAASFPQINLFINPAPWIRFNYIHAWLNSLVLDSSNFYYNHTESREPYLRQSYISKYFVGNILTISTTDYLDFSIGNSFIYSGALRPEMFIPFMYYKVMDHNTGRGVVDDGNGQIFFDLGVRFPKTFRFYSTLLIDLLEIRDILKGSWYTSRFGYTVGVRKTDLLIENLSISLEYSKTNQFVYENKDETASYKHLNYSLGHWIGQNADHLRLQFDYIMIRGLKLSVYGERLRKGGMNDIVEAYKYRSNTPFLSGSLRKDYRFGIRSVFEILHDVFLKAGYEYSDISDEDKYRTPSFMLGKKNNYLLLVNYGL